MKSAFLVVVTSLAIFLPSQGVREPHVLGQEIAPQTTVKAVALSHVEPLQKTYADLVGNSYDRGSCTDWAASHADVINFLGNANMWDDGARAYGVPVSNIPKVGAVAQTDAGSAGHVAIVEAISGDSVLISEYNHIGLGIEDERWVSASSYRYLYF